jgi:hypothetical protein
MLVNTRVNKENIKEKLVKKGSTPDETANLKTREFGTELTNNTDASSDCGTDEKTPFSAEVILYESNVPKATILTKKMSDHYSGVLKHKQKVFSISRTFITSI